MKRLLISGGTSFIGKALAGKARMLGWDVIAVVRKGKILPMTENLTVLNLDMEEYQMLGQLVGKCDCFVHLTWNGTRGAARMDRELQHMNRKYSLDAVQSVLNAGCRCIISAGSQAEYGPQDGIISETTECSPNTAYGREKLAFYHDMVKLCQKTRAQYREPRFFSLYGPDDYLGSMIMSTLECMLHNVPCRLTQGLQMWDFLYIDDAVEGLLKLCDPAVPNGVYNFGSGDARPLRSFIEEMAQITDTKSELLFGAVPYPATGMVSIWPDISKLKTELNWSAKTSFCTGIQKILNKIS